MDERNSRIGLWTILAIGGWTRCLGIAGRSLWFDEASSWWMATRFGGIELLDRCAANVHPPLYYLLLAGWTAIWGDSPFALRLLSVLAGLGTVIGGALLTAEVAAGPTGVNADMPGPPARARQPGARSLGLAAAALLATNTGQLTWSQEIRMYAPCACATVVSGWLLLRGLNRGQSEGVWGLAALSAACLPYLHNYGLWTLLGQTMFVAGGWWWSRGSPRVHPSDHRPAWGTAAFYWAFAWLLYLPWLPGLFLQTNSVRQSYWIWVFDGWSLPYAYYDLFDPDSMGRRASPWLVSGVTCALAATMWGLRPRSRGERLLWLMGLTPPLFAGLVSCLMSPIVISRYLLFSQTAMLCAVPIVWSRWLPPIGGRALLGVLCLGQWGLFVSRHWDDARGDRPGVRGAAEYLRRERVGSEPIVVEHTGLYPPLAYHFQDDSAVRLVAWTDRLAAWNGRPFLTAGRDYFSPDEIAAWPVDELWVVNGTGYGGSFSRFEVGPQWSTIAGSERRFADIDAFRGTVIVRKCRREPTP